MPKRKKEVLTYPEMYIVMREEEFSAMCNNFPETTAGFLTAVARGRCPCVMCKTPLCFVYGVPNNLAAVLIVPVLEETLNSGCCYSCAIKYASRTKLGHAMIEAFRRDSPSLGVHMVDDVPDDAKNVPDFRDQLKPRRDDLRSRGEPKR